MIQPKDVDKGKALEALWQRLGLSASQAVGFGDDWNDLSLLHACGTGIAVENALPCDGEMSYEERMGCGFGACVGCTCQTKSGAKRVCKDGPVFKKGEVLA